jgi:type IV fimbrial biogenesis protein FimT
MDWHQNCCNPEQQKLEMKVMHKNSGFTIMELMTTIAIIALLAAIAVPNMIRWRSTTRLQGAVENLRGDLQWAKLKAVQENGSVAVLFSVNGYEVFTDDGPTQVGAFHAADNERRLRNRDLPTGVSIDLAVPPFGSNLYVNFNNRGFPDNAGAVVVVSSGGDLPRTIDLNRLGGIDIIIN